jgi:virulence factor Mce-like protein
MSGTQLRAGAGLVVAVAVLIAVIAHGGSESRYRVTLLMPTAEGIRKNSDVRMGGVTVGKVKDLRVTPADEVEADLDIDAGHTIGTGASADILAVNLLGEKYVALDPGNTSRPQPSGLTIPSQRITPSVDLDQVLDVLDPDTRTRLRLLINEAGIALAGRGMDLNRVLAQLPGGLAQAAELLDQLVSDNRALTDVVDRADSFVSRLTAQKADLARFVESADGAAATFAAKAAALERTLATAPAALRTLRSFVTELRPASAPLGPAARTLAATAPKLDATLEALPAFRRVLVPTLDEAIKTAPSLTRLGVKATPVIRRAVPASAALTTFTDRVQPTTKVLGASIDDLLGVLEGWGRAIQGRDGLSHVFHGQVTLGADAVKTIIDAVTPAAPAKKQGGSGRRPPVIPGLPLLDPRPPATHVDPQSVAGAVKDVPEAVGKTVQGLLDALTGAKPDAPPAPAPGRSATQTLLDHLLKP